jgi:hypothetical protein
MGYFKDYFHKLSGDYDINQCINNFSELIHDISAQCFGKTFRASSKSRKRKSPWFNEDCRRTKAIFFSFETLIFT